jgi:hypothetical protein
VACRAAVKTSAEANASYHSAWPSYRAVVMVQWRPRLF